MPENQVAEKRAIYFLTALEVRIQDQSVGRYGFAWGLSPWLGDSLFLTVSSHGLFFFFLYVFIPPISPTSYEDINHIILETIHMASFDLNYLFDGPISKDSPILRYTTKVYWRLVRTSTYWWRRDRILS